VARSSTALRYSRGLAVALEFSGTIAAGAFIGWYLDDRLGWTPWASIVATVLAAIGAFIRLVQMLRRLRQLDDASQH
jgi:F0F1-type ATP synthase assembly protein I